MCALSKSRHLLPNVLELKLIGNYLQVDIIIELSDLCHCV